MSKSCPIHGPAGKDDYCDLCLNQGKNIIRCPTHGFQHVEAKNCLQCAGKGIMAGEIVHEAVAPNPKTGRWPRVFEPRNSASRSPSQGSSKDGDTGDMILKGCGIVIVIVVVLFFILIMKSC